jgi:low affinity Fe/Cu permease
MGRFREGVKGFLQINLEAVMMQRCGAWFAGCSRGVARGAGHPVAFGLCCAAIVVWAALGPLCGWSDTWQLVINTGTTIVTFLMVFLIQNTQNRDSAALHAKLDELDRAVPGARDLAGLEDLTDEEIAWVRRRRELTGAPYSWSPDRSPDDYQPTGQG